MEEVKKLLDSGMSDVEVVSSLENEGYTSEEASNALAQAKIRYAVSEQNQQNSEQEMQPSVLSSNQQQTVEETPDYQQYNQAIPQEYQQQYQQNYSQQDYQNYPQYSYSSSSSDAVSEIAEQIVSEKFSQIKNQLEKSIDMRNTMETKLNYIDERLKRLERIIDKLQMSILDKVTSQMSNVEDIKRELIETQKTFKAMGSRK